MPEWRDEIRKRLAALRLEPTREAEIAEELAQHLEDRYEMLLRSGATEDEAQQSALLELSEGDLLAQELRQVERTIHVEPTVLGARRRTNMFGDLRQDLRYGLKVLLQKPGFTAVAVIALALGIGANTAIFSVVNTVLLRPLPYNDPSRLMMVWMDNRRLSMDQDIHSYPNYVDYRDQSHVFSHLTAITTRNFNLTGDGEPERVVGAAATAGFFGVMDVAPALGRGFTTQEDQSGQDPVVVLSYSLWQRRFGGHPGIIGRQVALNGANRTVVGVMPAGFNFPSTTTELWVPLAPDQNIAGARGAFWLTIVGRLKPDVTLEQARAELNTIAKRLEDQYPDINAGYGVNLVPLHEQVVGKIRPALLVLLGAVALVLLIACANVANLLLARAAVRGREIAIRSALGASRGRVVRQLLTESLLLSALGAAVGLLLALWGISALKSLAPSNTPRVEQISIDGRVLAFTLAVSCVTALVFGVVPALLASKPDLNGVLKEGSKGSVGGRRGSRIRQLLVISEIALALVLLIGAGLLLKSFKHLQDVDLGFNPDNLLTVQLQVPRAKYREPQQVKAFYDQLLERLGSEPGVESAGAITSIFLSSTPNSTNVNIEGRPVPSAAEAVEVPFDSISPNYFRVMGTPLLKGRPFNERDVEGTTEVVIINETFARRFFPGEDPLGKRIKYGDPANAEIPWVTIVGVIADVRRTGYESAVRPETYLPYTQRPASMMSVVVRGTRDAAALSSTVRNAVQAIDRDQPVYNVKTMEHLISEMISQRRFSALLLGVFAAIALLLAAVGLYGVMAYSVAQRTHEIGIRMALGAQKADVMKLVVGQGMLLALIGTGIGLAGAVVVTRLMSSLLYGVSTTDPATFVSIALLLILIALLACYLPARRAMKVDPMIALRYE